MPRSDRATAPPVAADPPAAATPPGAQPSADTQPAGINPAEAKPAGDAAPLADGTSRAEKPAEPAQSEPAAAKSKPTAGKPAAAEPAEEAKPTAGKPAAAEPAEATKPSSAEKSIAKPARKAAVTSKLAEAKTVSAKDEPVDATPTDAKPAGKAAEPATPKPADAKAVAATPADKAKATPPATDKPADKATESTAPAKNKPADTKPADAKPADAKAAKTAAEAKDDAKDAKDEPPTPDKPPAATVTAEASAPRRPLPALAAAILAALSGTVMVTAFPPYGLWYLAPIAIALLAVATRGQRIRRGAWLGALHGAAFFAPLLHWTGIYVGPMPWLLLAGLQTAFLAILGAAAAGSSRLVTRLPWLAPLVTATLWVGQEALRSRLPWGGFPWGRVAFSQDESPFLRLASLGGAPLVTFAVALSGGLIVAALYLPWRTRRIVPWLGRVALVAGAVALAVAGLAVPLTKPDGRSVNIAVVQGNVPRLGLDFNAQRRAVLEYHVQATRNLAARVTSGEVRQPDLVVWPENSSDIDPLKDPIANAEITSAALQINAPILVGAVLDGPGRFVSNAGIVWDPQTGPGAQYLKRHPVPFAEYVPLRDVARKVTDKVDLVRRDFKGGDKVGVLKLGPATIGDVICFEVAYDDLVRDTVDGGAELLVVQTNNATFGKSAESVQQLAMVRLRAVEHGRPSIMASTSGVSAMVSADGRVLEQSELFTVATFVREMKLGEHRTLATKLGGWPEAVLALAGLAALLAAVGLRYRRRGHSDAAPTVETTSEPPASSGPEQTGVDEKDDQKDAADTKAAHNKEDA